jgi:hypothetical protein
VLNQASTLALLEKLKLETAGDALSIYLPPHLPTNESDPILKNLSAPDEILAEVEKIGSTSATGAAIFWSPSRKIMVTPPFPIISQLIKPGFDTDTLQTLLQRKLHIALVLIRLGSYAIGLCDNESLISSKNGTGLVHGRHRQGGSSAARFRRHREKQIEYFLTRVCQHAREQLEQPAKSIDYIVYGGAWTTILLLKKQCSFLEQFEDRNLPPLLDIPEPRHAVLETAISRIWSSTLYEWTD